jgi:hypothetical protein
MGQSTDAILFWGYCWDEERAWPWDDPGADEEETASERYARLTGLKQPDNGYPMEIDKSPEADAIRARHAEYWQAENEAWNAVRMEVGTHCHGECPMPYVAVGESHTLASRGTPEPISSLAVGEDWRARLDSFCSLMGIEPPGGQQPQWWLVSDWH